MSSICVLRVKMQVAMNEKKEVRKIESKVEALDSKMLVR